VEDLDHTACGKLYQCVALLRFRNVSCSSFLVDGLRIDSAKSVNKAFYPPFEQAAGVYIAGEVYEGNPTTFCDYQNYMDGMLNFPS
jgi:hypothetical protein